jgi:hypothetical protein
MPAWVTTKLVRPVGFKNILAVRQLAAARKPFLRLSLPG